MSTNPQEVAKSIVGQYDAREVSFPRLVRELERIVDESESRGDLNAGEMRRLWGQMEIINSLRPNGEISVADREEVLDLGHRLTELMAE